MIEYEAGRVRGPRSQITVVTPTIPDRVDLLEECRASVRAAGLPHLVELDYQKIGPAKIRNRLAAQVTTPWLVFLDDDDLLYPEYPDVVARHFMHADLIYTGWDLEGAEDPQPVPLDPFLLSWRNIIPVTACLRTEVFHAVGGFPEDVPLEDHELWKKILLAWDSDRKVPAYRMVYEPQRAWKYRRLIGSISDTEDRPWLSE